MAWAVSLMRLRRPRWRASARRFSGCAMPCSTRIQCAECALRGHSYISSYQSGAFFLNLQGGGVTDTSAGLYARTLVADIRGGFGRRPVGQELDQPQLARVGDVRATGGLGRAAPQRTFLAVRDHHGFDGVLLAPAGDDLVR